MGPAVVGEGVGEAHLDAVARSVGAVAATGRATTLAEVPVVVVVAAGDPKLGAELEPAVVMLVPATRAKGRRTPPRQLGRDAALARCRWTGTVAIPRDDPMLSVRAAGDSPCRTFLLVWLPCPD